MVKVGFRTDVGRVRKGNEDALLVLQRSNLYVVADGVGGHNSGEVASRKAVNTIEEFVAENPIEVSENMDGKYRHNWFESYFLRCFQKVNSEIISISQQEPDKAGMATTAVLAYVDESMLYLTNIGDSRAYMVRDGEITQLTEDHSLINKLIQAGALTRTEAEDHPDKNMITRALGAETNVEPDFYHFELHDKDRVVLCTDGLHGELSDEEICGIIKQESDLNMACKKLVRAANERGGHDNTTIICLEV
jgi:protein phosphatase